MADKKRFSVKPGSGQFTATNMGAVATVMVGAFRATVAELAQFHEGKPGPWLDELEKNLIREAKGTVTEGIAIEADAEAVQLGVDVLQAALDATRARLVAADEKE
jgi:hypothetical protein